MIERLASLALEATDIDEAADWYEGRLGLQRHARSVDALYVAVGDTVLGLRLPTADPPGGQHVHIAFSTGADALADWHTRLAPDHDITTHAFGSFESLYVTDPFDHCIEIANRGSAGGALTAIFEVVLAIADLDAAIARYESLGFNTISRSEDRPRARLTLDSFDLELWEPHRGIADARPGRHVELGFAVVNVEEASQTAREAGFDATDDPSVLLDPDGHRLVFRT